jgi:LuxR family transcriptional regulator, maltose regulon positive regulatory protein
VLEALCLVDDGRSSDAQALIGRALELAAPGGWVRVLADEGTSMAQLLADLVAASSPDTPSTAVVYARRVLSAIVPEGEATPAGITPRELEILRLIVAGLSNVVIARQLVLTHATVKTHVNNLYKKLGVRNRVQALERARQLGMLL